MLLGPGLFERVSAQDPVPLKVVLKDSVTVYFRPSKSALEPAFSGNAVALEEFFSRMDAVLDGKKSSLVKMVIRPGSSPEGPAALNARLAKERRASILNCIGSRVNLPENLEITAVETVDWDLFRSFVSADKDMPKELKDKTLAVLDNNPGEGDFKARVGQSAWTYVHDHFFPALRSASAVLVWEVEEPAVALRTTPKPEPAPEKQPEPQPAPEQAPAPAPEPPMQPVLIGNVPVQVTTRDFVVKLNFLTLPALVLNGGIEAQFADHFSAALTAYYSGWDYFTAEKKLRTFMLQPEARYWVNSDLHGFFIGLHGTLGWYNYSWGGEYRYQDNRPTLGGGVSAGYKFRLGGDNSPWGLEAGLGLGVVPLHYDLFYNVPNGRLAGTGNYTYWGPDQAFLSLTYRFGQIKHPVK